MAKLTEHMKQLIKQHPVAFVATSGGPGWPNVSPKGVLQILDDDKLVFADILSQKTRANLATNPLLALAVVDIWMYEGYQIKGRAEFLEQGPLYDRIADLLARSSNGPQPMETWYDRTARSLMAALGRAGRAHLRPSAVVVLHIEEIWNLTPGHESEVWRS
jgi:uncharacterized protein